VPARPVRFLRPQLGLLSSAKGEGSGNIRQKYWIPGNAAERDLIKKIGGIIKGYGFHVTYLPGRVTIDPQTSIQTRIGEVCNEIKIRSAFIRVRIERIRFEKEGVWHVCVSYKMATVEGMIEALAKTELHRTLTTEELRWKGTEDDQQEVLNREFETIKGAIDQLLAQENYFECGHYYPRRRLVPGTKRRVFASAPDRVKVLMQQANREQRQEFRIGPPTSEPPYPKEFGGKARDLFVEVARLEAMRESALKDDKKKIEAQIADVWKIFHLLVVVNFLVLEDDSASEEASEGF